MKEIIHLETDPGEMLAACGVNRYDHDVMPDRRNVTCPSCLATMTNPDEFPPAGTWSVNKNLNTGVFFITESQGDGTATLAPVPYSPYSYHEIRYCEILEQICLRHNEGNREEEG